MSTNEFAKNYPLAYTMLKMGIDILIDLASETDGHYLEAKIERKNGEVWTITTQEIKDGENNDN